MNIIKHKNWYFLFSILVILPGIVSLFLYGLNLSIDFTGGSRMGLLFPQNINAETKNIILKTYAEEKIQVVTIQVSGKQVFIKTPSLNDKQDIILLKKLQQKVGIFKQEEFATIGPTIGRELTANAFKAIIVSSLLIMGYVAWSFRKVPKPASSLRFGICTIIALLHDALLLLGIFSLLGHFWKVEIDSLFVTAVLTVIGFSVHDTIVVFDRIRENLQRTKVISFAGIVNDSILQTLIRSLNTSLTALLVLFSLLIFGGESIRWFVVALLIGIASGTYSSIFNAAPLLVAWQEWEAKRSLK